MPEDINDGRGDAALAGAVAGETMAVGMAEAAEPALGPLLGDSIELKEFRRQGVTLSVAHRKLIVEQALVLVEQNYVHLPHKAAMHAVNPVQRLRLLRARLENTTREALPPADEFHAEMSEIFHSMRDLHTNYLLPEPYASRVAFLPFLVEEYFTDTVPQYMVTKVARGADLAGLEPGVLVTHWNGMPIDRAVEVNAARYAGSNAPARHTRGVESFVPPLATGAELPRAESLTVAERLAVYLPDRSSVTAAGALDALVGDTPDRDLYAGEIAYHMSQDPTISAAVAASAPDGSTAEAGFGPTQTRFALERLRQVASPPLAGHLR